MGADTQIEKEWNMIKLALLVRLEAKPGKAAELEKLFCAEHCRWWNRSRRRPAWFGIRLGPTTFGIFDGLFRTNRAGKAHLSGKVAAALMAKAPELLAEPPVIEKAEVLAVKLPA